MFKTRAQSGCVLNKSVLLQKSSEEETNAGVNVASCVQTQRIRSCSFSSFLFVNFETWTERFGFHQRLPRAAELAALFCYRIRTCVQIKICRKYDNRSVLQL